MGLNRLEDKVAIVTGGSRGIGCGIARSFAEEGAKVAVVGRSQSTLDDVVAGIEAAGGVGLAIACDVGERDQVYAMVAAAAERFGTVDILVNAAQAFGSSAEQTLSPLRIPLEDSDEEEWDTTLRSGLMGTLWAMKAAFPYLKQGGGKIINFGSLAGQLGLEFTGAYAATKEAIRGLSRVAAREWGQYGINVNVINPWIQTDAVEAYWEGKDDLRREALNALPMRGIGMPKDAGSLAVFLASDESTFITGMTVMLDGGQYMSP